VNDCANNVENPAAILVGENLESCVQACATGASEAADVIIGQDVCQCPADQILNAAMTECVMPSTCAVVSLSGMMCVTSCPGINEVLDDSTEPATCICKEDTFLSLSKDECIPDCIVNPNDMSDDDNGVISIDGESCLENCDQGTLNPDTNQCECSGGTTIIDIDGDTCVSACTSGNLNLASTVCVIDCPSGSTATSNVCECDSDTILSGDFEECFTITVASAGNPTSDEKAAACVANGQFLAEDEAACVLVCPSVVDFDNEKCLASCPGDLIAATSGRCECAQGNYFDPEAIASPFCVTDCASATTAGSINLAGDQCITDACNTLDNQVDSTTTPTQCVCADNAFLDADGENCVTECDASSS